jgi:hypothetical protein
LLRYHHLSIDRASGDVTSYNTSGKDLPVDGSTHMCTAWPVHTFQREEWTIDDTINDGDVPFGEQTTFDFKLTKALLDIRDTGILVDVYKL